MLNDSNRSRVKRSRSLALTCFVIRLNPRRPSWFGRLVRWCGLGRRPAPLYLTAIKFLDGGRVLSREINDAIKFPTHSAAEDYRWAELVHDPDFLRFQSVAATIAGLDAEE